MHTIYARNVNDALIHGVELLRRDGIHNESRAGEVLRYPSPVTTVYRHPTERVLFHAWRDANPFFHLVEAVWMLAGRDDIRSLTPYVARMKDFSDDGETQPGAYGKRWRDHRSEGYPIWPDQLDWVVNRLRNDPNDRRAVISMWDPATDCDAADADGRDVPCNLTALPWAQGGRLHLTVFCRSNDIIWGAYGANAVHFSVLLEYLAGRLGLEVGTYTQISNNFHGYLNTMPPEDLDVVAQYNLNPYARREVLPFPMFDKEAFWPYASEDKDALWSDVRRERTIKEDLLILFEHGPVEAATKARWPWLRQVVVPLMLAHRHWKGVKGPDRYEGAFEIAQQCAASDWRLAATQWLARRKEKAEA